MIAVNRKVIYAAIFCFVSFAVNAQIDAHYWTHQYGAKGLLLNGAVIASSDDETAIFYNPACMGQGNNLGFVFSFLTPTYSSLETTNFTGNGSSFKDEDLGFSPGFAAVRIKPFKTDKIILGVASFQRLSSNISYKDRTVLPVENFYEIFYLADVEFKRELSQEWLGVGLSYNIMDNLGVGISQYSIWHDESLQFDFKKEILLTEDPETLALGWRSDFGYGINAYGGWLTKLGFIWGADNFKLGLTYTSPSYGFIHKSASYNFDEERITATDIQVQSNQKDTPLHRYKTPASFGLGFEYRFDDLTVSFSTEYFKGLKEYTLFEETDDPYEGLAGSGFEKSILVSTSNNSVTNFALGFQRKVNEKLTWIWGFRTDYNQNNNLNINDIADYLSSSPSIYHVSGGARFIGKNNELSIGFDYGYGKKSGGRQLSDLSNFNIFNFYEFSSQNNVNTIAHSLMIFLTYDFLFGKIREAE
ncbi:MAG: hypothetical protein KJO29_14265 [Bacteroidia bacterium]|nr:hypothetical protein [Bacteroidia bacterium]